MIVAKGNLIMNIQPCFKPMYEGQGWNEVVDEPKNDTGDNEQNTAQEISKLCDSLSKINSDGQVNIVIDGEEIAKAVKKKPSTRSMKK